VSIAGPALARRTCRDIVPLKVHHPGRTRPQFGIRFIDMPCRRLDNFIAVDGSSAAPISVERIDV
jgi:hypothetical protein